MHSSTRFVASVASCPGRPEYSCDRVISKCRPVRNCMQFQSAFPARKSAVFHSKKRQRLQHLAAGEEGMSVVALTCIIKSEYHKDALAQGLVSPVLKLMQRNKLNYLRSSKSVFLRSNKQHSAILVCLTQTFVTCCRHHQLRCLSSLRHGVVGN